MQIQKVRTQGDTFLLMQPTSSPGFEYGSPQTFGQPRNILAQLSANRLFWTQL